MRTALWTAVLIIIAGSLWTAPRRPPGAGAPLLEGAEVPGEVRSLIDRSCRDCHSDRTRYPWYSYVAPVSILVGRDVKAGRARLNFSHWDEYTLTRRLRFLSDIANQVEEREMPLSLYTAIHRDARLSDEQIQAVFRWTQAERLRLIHSSEPRP